MEPLSRVLALDHGERRIGVAISDELGMIAQPLEFISADPEQAALDRIHSLVTQRSVGMVLVGMPRNMDGSYGPAAEKVKAFVERLKPSLAVPIRLWDERLTSVQANRALREVGVRGSKRKGRIDATAAAILLQSYLDSR